MSQVYPDLERVLEKMLVDGTAGDPMTERKWVRLSSREISRQLHSKGYAVSYHTVCDVLKRMGYSMKVNVRQRNTATVSPMRDMQFQYISSQKTEFLRLGLPVVSVDSKKKELIGNFKADGRSWCKDPVKVDEYRFASKAECVATPYGIYDVAVDKGYVYVGTSVNSPAFAVTALTRWWGAIGKKAYRDATELLILADGGGNNGFRSGAWKKNLQLRLSNRFGLRVTVCHYPPYCSKFNPVERRLFSHISMNWAGKPLKTLEVMLGYIRGTKTQTGLSVKAYVVDGEFERREKVSKKELERLDVHPHAVCPEWNYTIHPLDSFVK